LSKLQSRRAYTAAGIEPRFATCGGDHPVGFAVSRAHGPVFVHDRLDRLRSSRSRRSLPVELRSEDRVPSAALVPVEDGHAQQRPVAVECGTLAVGVVQGLVDLEFALEAAGSEFGVAN
jgi:hypothetical protein